MTLDDFLRNPNDLDMAIALYEAHFGKNRVKRDFAARNDRVLLKNITYRLNKLAQKNIKIILPSVLPVVEAQKVEKIEPIAKVEEPVHETIVNYTNDLAGKEMQARDLYRQAGKLRHKLYSDSKDERKTAALEIVRKMKRNREIWDEINYFNQHGIWPVAQAEPISIDISMYSIPDLIALQKNLPPWITKEKKKIDKITDKEKKAKKVEHLESKIQLLAEVRQKLSKL